MAEKFVNATRISSPIPAWLEERMACDARTGRGSVLPGGASTAEERFTFSADLIRRIRRCQKGWQILHGPGNEKAHFSPSPGSSRQQFRHPLVSKTGHARARHPEGQGRCRYCYRDRPPVQRSGGRPRCSCPTLTRSSTSRCTRPPEEDGRTTRRPRRNHHSLRAAIAEVTSVWSNRRRALRSPAGVGAELARAGSPDRSGADLARSTSWTSTSKEALKPRILGQREGAVKAIYCRDARGSGLRHRRQGRRTVHRRHDAGLARRKRRLSAYIKGAGSDDRGERRSLSRPGLARARSSRANRVNTMDSVPLGRHVQS